MLKNMPSRKTLILDHFWRVRGLPQLGLASHRFFQPTLHLPPLDHTSHPNQQGHDQEI
jgi:hypothetical protein